ncbi:aldo/keto reductase [Palleronia sediminis]|uniref:Aldo/keto reductase n=1 Tax=Palleronia sediminis TaxID=2547833 RepID=A0A4R6AL01_9RHOB|nr:aldo/keto reductase [Palleronia sediminis]TDL84297.1 aldo/keto reductase [Palleronia sediminis]
MPVTPIGPAAIPSLGLGTFEMERGATAALVRAAISEGYRHIDTAQVYGNEAEVGQGVRAAETPRDEIFVTTKILPDRFAPDEFRRAAEESLRRLDIGHIDLLLLHWPSREVPLSETLPVLDALIDEGKVRFGGVSNFTVAQLKEARGILRAPLAANQVELHPFIDQSTLLAHMQAERIPVEAYSPLARGKVVDDPTLTRIAEAHGATAAQVSLAWILSKPDAVVLPKTGNPDRLASNLAAAELSLSAEEIAEIDALAGPGGRIISPESVAPDWDD